MKAWRARRKRLFTTEPHGEQDVILLEDASRPDDRIYEIVDRHETAAAVRILGSELASLRQWWDDEKHRPGRDETEDA